MIGNNDYDVIIAGGGPAGSSAATFLAMRGARVLLVEEKKFPRPKLCGEFISPECAALFGRLGVAERMFAAQPARLIETVFYSANGRAAHVPSSWLGNTGAALGLSRAEMDERLLRRASDSGADIIEKAHVSSLIIENETAGGVRLKHDAQEEIYRATITIDATGRARALTRHVALDANGKKHDRRPMVAFKAHLRNTNVAPGACEIYFYRGGYGGLSSIENGLSNLCFIASARDVRACDGNAERVMREVVCQNRRAAFTLKHACTESPWLAVSLEGFGRYPVTPLRGLLAIGDAASFIDPFTGSGMLMALQSGELAAEVIGNYLESATNSETLADLNSNYHARYYELFDSRLRICSLLRKAAFVPGLAQLAVTVCGASSHVRRRLARATRGRTGETYSAT